VSWRILQALLGHKSPLTPGRGTHLTSTTFDGVHATITALMAARSPRWGADRPEVADVFRADGPADQERCGAARLPGHRRAMAGLIPCRTEALGGQRWPGDHCGQEPYADHSGRHRRGPACHRQDTEGWRAARRQALLPVPWVPVVLTLPQALREPGRRRQKDRDDMGRRAAAHALITPAAAPHEVGGLIGVLGVRHTWPRTLGYHPHGHGLVPAGGVSADRTAWRPARASYVIPVHALATLFRGLCLALVRHERPDLTRPESVWTEGWVVYGQPTGHGAEPVLNSPGRDVHRSALTHHRRLAIAAGPVRFRSQDSQDQRWRTLTLAADECIRRFRRPGLPQGFHNVRDYGLGSPVHRPPLPQLQRCPAGRTAAPPPAAPEPAPQPSEAWGPPLRAGHCCPSGGQGLPVVRRFIPRPQRGPP
jgi:Putative transposase/Transposase zinc-binding domain